jgi:DNA-binding response OmpR family regulator
MRILVAEDKPRMARLMQRALRDEGYSVCLAADGDEALDLGIAGGLDAIVLDVMLPRRDGFDVIRNLRAARAMAPTIIVSARDTMSDIVQGLDAGADDYLAKPFSLEVFLARVRALTRRGPAAYPSELQFQDLRLNPRTHEMERAGRVAPLTRTEYSLLEVMIRRAGCVVPRDVLVEAGWGGGAEVSENTLYVFIRSLRSKIACEGQPQLLHTVRGVGYTLRNSLA